MVNDEGVKLVYFALIVSAPTPKSPPPIGGGDKMEEAGGYSLNKFSAAPALNHSIWFLLYV